jgi:hypothetical protein
VLVLIAGKTPDTLTDVTSAWTRDVEIRWDRDCDGTAEPVDELPLAPNLGGPQTRRARVPTSRTRTTFA